jgi:hypothetical protein
VQTDKDIYVTGEDVRFKFWLTDANGRADSLSRVGYVELFNGEESPVRVKIDVEGGISDGYLSLPSTLPTGYYRLIAYTRYMTGEGEGAFFKRMIGVVNPYRADRSVRTDTSARVAGNAGASASGNIVIRANTSQPTYPVRTEGSLRIDGIPSDMRSMAVSIAGKAFIPLPEKTDVGAWKNSLGATGTAVSSVLPEYEGNVIEGRIVNAQTGQPAVGERPFALLGFTGRDVRVFGSQADSLGNVSFHTGRIRGMQQAGVVAYGYGGGQYRVELTSPYVSHERETLPAFGMNPEWNDALQERSMGVQVQYAFMGDSMRRSLGQVPFFRWQPDHSYILNDYNRFPEMNVMFIEFIPSLSFQRLDGERRVSVLMKDFTRGRSLVLLDGVPVWDHDFVYNYDTRLLERVDVYRDRFYFGGQAFDGIVSFHSFGANHPELRPTETLRFFENRGTQAPRIFYSPDYGRSVSATESRVPDYRHTLLWMPEVETGGSSSVDVPFATSDLTGEYEVTVEGLTRDGQPLRATATFRVE